jgi:SnoaL-like domain
LEGFTTITPSWQTNGFGRFEGKQAIVDAVGAVARKTILWCVHYMVAPLIEIGPSGKEATCSWYLWQLAKVRGDDGMVHDSWIAGYYDTTASLGPEGWAFDHVTLDVRLISPVGVPWEPGGTNAG